MANWANVLDLRDEHRGARRGDILADQYAHRVATKMRQLPCADAEFSQIVALFESVKPSATFDDIDIILERLYDWGDAGHKCWIKIF